MTTTYIRRCTPIDKATILAALSAAGLKVRIRHFPTTMRVCLNSEATDAARETVCHVLNAHGYRYAGGSAFTPRHFNQPHEVFVAGVAA